MDILELIPAEVILIIFSNVPPTTVIKLATVSKAFHKFSIDNFLWRQFLNSTKYKQLTNNSLVDYKTNSILEKFCQRAKSMLKFDELFETRKIWVCFFGLTTIPSELGQLTKLEQLSLWGNKLSTIPQELGQLTNLQELCLTQNQITSIPIELVQLTNLHKLYLWGNQLTTIPKEFGQLTNLQELSLFNNKLTSIPKELGLLTNLVFFEFG